MGNWNTVNISYVLDKNRIDADFYKKSDVELELFLNKSCNGLKIKNIASEVQERFKKSMSEEFQYNDIGNTDIRFGKINTNILKSINAPGRASFINQIDDILISTVRPNRNANAIVNQKDFLQVVSNGFCNLRTKGINANYIFIFSKTKYFIDTLIRATTSSMYPSVSNKNILEVPFYLPLNNEVEYISKLVSDARELIIKSEKYYVEATKILEQEIGLDDIKFETPKNYFASFSEAIDFMRIDSEYFQPKFRKINELVKSYKNGYERLLSNIIYVKPDFNVSSHKVANIKYIELSKINPVMGFIDDVDEIDKKDAPSRAKRMVMTGDVIASSVVGSVDKAGLVSENENGFIASNGFFQFRSNYYSPEFLLILIKSTIIKEQFQQQSTGGILSAVPEQNLKHIVIPKIDIDIQKKITVLVKDAHQKARTSKDLLAQAKNRVEQLIEEAATKN